MCLLFPGDETIRLIPDVNLVQPSSQFNPVRFANAASDLGTTVNVDPKDMAWNEHVRMTNSADKDVKEKGLHQALIGRTRPVYGNARESPEDLNGYPDSEPS